MEETCKVSAVSETVDHMTSNAHEAVDKMADAVAQAAGAIDEKSGELKAIQREWLEKSRTYIHDNPMKSIGIALVGGFLLSRLLSHR